MVTDRWPRFLYGDILQKIHFIFHFNCHYLRQCS